MHGKRCAAAQTGFAPEKWARNTKVQSCILVGKCCFGLETIKISTHPCYPITDFHGDEAKKLKKKILKKKSKIADSKKLSFSTPPILNIFLQKFKGLVLG